MKAFTPTHRSCFYNNHPIEVLSVTPEEIKYAHADGAVYSMEIADFIVEYKPIAEAGNAA